MKKLIFLSIFLPALSQTNVFAVMNHIVVFNNGCQASITPLSCNSGANIFLDGISGCGYASGIHCVNVNSVFTFEVTSSSPCDFNLDYTKNIVEVALKDNNTSNAIVFLDNNCNAKVCYNGACGIKK